MTAPQRSLSRAINEAIALFFSASTDYEARLTDEGFLVLTGAPAADLNMVAIWGEAGAEVRLREFGARVVQRDLPCLMLMTAEQSERLAGIAGGYGFGAAGACPLMVYEPTSDFGQRPDYAVRRVASEEARRQWVDTVAAGFALDPIVARQVWGPGMLDTPGLTLFLAQRNGQPVSGVSSTCRGSTVGIWAMGTPPAYQRQGAGAAVLSYAINYHRASGGKLFYLIATEQGQPLYRKLGFTTIAELPIWVRGRSTQAPG